MTETTEQAQPVVDLVVTDPAGNEFHAYASEYGDQRLPAWAAERESIAGDIRYRRWMRVTFPRYSKYDAVRAAIEAALLPWERLYRVTGEHWGGEDVSLVTELIFPSSSWCVDCGHDVRPDRYGRVSPYAVYRTGGTGREWVSRNWSHLDAHLAVAEAHANGDTRAHMGIDACG